MSVSTTTSDVSYNGNGVTTVFAIPFDQRVNADLKVSLTDTSDVTTILTVSTHYTLNAVPATSVTMLTAPATGEVLRVYRDTPQTQPTEFDDTGQFLLSSLETQMDRQTLMLQEMQTDIDDINAILDDVSDAADSADAAALSEAAAAASASAAASSAATASHYIAETAVVPTASSQLTLTTAAHQMFLCTPAAAISLNASPFSSTPATCMLATIVGRSNTNTITVLYSNSAGGCLLNGDCTLGADQSLTVAYSPTLARWVEVGRNF